MSKIKVILADDHKIVVEGLSALLHQAESIDLVGTAKNGVEAVKLVKKHEIDVAIIDIEMPKLDGIEATKRILKISNFTKVLILSMHKEPEFIIGLIEAGASGYVLKERGSEELVDAIETLAMGKEYFGAEVTSQLILNHRKKKKIRSYHISLTKREKEVLIELSNGLTSAAAAEKLHIAPSTVESHRKNMLEKLGASNTTQLVKKAMQKGLLE